MTTSGSLKKIERLLEQEKALEAKAAFDRLVPENSVDYYLISGKIEQKFQHWGDAINAFYKVLGIDPENTEAQSSLHLIRNVLNFWNPDVFNP